MALNVCSKCWICEGWTQVQFKFNPYETLLTDGRKAYEELDENTQVFIHLSSDEFEADLMERNEQSGEFTITRMVPPGRIEYYFSIG